jgi:hypothetical protein
VFLVISDAMPFIAIRDPGLQAVFLGPGSSLRFARDDKFERGAYLIPALGAKMP